MVDGNFYIEFKITDKERFENLLIFFDKLKEIKNLINSDENEIDPINHFDWLDLLDEKSLKWFENSFDFNSSEGKIYNQLWELTDHTLRIQHPFFITPGNWDLETLLDSIFNGDYELVEIVVKKEKIAELKYYPYGAPFGGTECLVSLLECFGQEVISDLWHEGPHVKIVSEWDYELAKDLVKRNVGFETTIDL